MGVVEEEGEEGIKRWGGGAISKVEWGEGGGARIS